MKEVSILAADIMDMYLQKYADENEDFFGNIDYWIRQVQDTYAALLDEEFKELYRLARQENVHKTALIEFENGWLKKEKVTLELDKETDLYKVTLAHRVLSFTYDNKNVGLQLITPTKRGSCTIIRSTLNDLYLDKFTPETEVVFCWLDDGILWFDKKCCNDVYVHYLPAAEATTQIAEVKADEIKTRVLNRMFAAKSQNRIIDVTNDSNPNAAPQTELNKETVNG